MKALLESDKLDKEAIDFSLVKVNEFIPTLENAISEANITLPSIAPRSQQGKINFWRT